MNGNARHEQAPMRKLSSIIRLTASRRRRRITSTLASFRPHWPCASGPQVWKLNRSCTNVTGLSPLALRQWNRGLTTAMNDNAQPLFHSRYLNFASYVDRTIMVRTIRNTICDSSPCPQSSCRTLIRGPFESMICARLITIPLPRESAGRCPRG